MAIEAYRTGPGDEVVVVRLPRHLDAFAGQTLREQTERNLPDVPKPGVVLDCTDVQLVSSIGITAILQVDEFARRKKAVLILASVSPKTRAFFEQLKLWAKFRSAETVAAAVDAIAAAQK